MMISRALCRNIHFCIFDSIWRWGAVVFASFYVIIANELLV